jgi:hypothetical protein
MDSVKDALNHAHKVVYQIKNKFGGKIPGVNC